VGATTGFIENGSFADDFTVAAATPRRGVLGGSVEARLPHHLSIELDVLYRRLSCQDGQYYSVGSTSENVTSGSLEFPVLLKYRFVGGAVRPYLVAGPAFDDLVGISNSWVNAPTLRDVGGQVTSGTNSSPMTLQNQAVVGISAGGGLDIRAAVVHIQPEIRSTRWMSPQFASSNQNQVEILLGISF
jgi:hypothetical protein